MPDESGAQQKVIAIVGPTASGKTSLGIMMAKRFHGEIVSADSRQIYRGMDIGTAKPSDFEIAEVPYHLINIKNPDEEYTVAEYKHDAITAITNLATHHHLPLLVGGTGLYINTVLKNLEIPGVEADEALRAELEKEIAEKGLPSIAARLVAVDPDAEKLVDLNNPRRVIRALEVSIATGKPFTAQQKKGEPLFDSLVIGIELPAEELRKRIDERIEEMMPAGFADEVKDLIEKYGPDAPAFDAIGYREMIAHVKDNVALDQTISAIKTETWHYARRQMTWFKKDKNVTWVGSSDEAMKCAEEFLE